MTTDTQPANARSSSIKLSDDIQELIEQYEKESGMLVDAVNLSRGGCTDSEPYRIYCVSVQMRVNYKWKGAT